MIVLHLQDVENIDPVNEEIIVLFNASPGEITFNDPGFVGKDFALHSIQQDSGDELVRASRFDSQDGSFTVAGRTAAVFNVLKEPVAEPTASQTATPEIPAIADPNILLTLIGVIGAFFAVITMMFALRRKDNK